MNIELPFTSMDSLEVKLTNVGSTIRFVLKLLGGKQFFQSFLQSLKSRYNFVDYSNNCSQDNSIVCSKNWVTNSGLNVKILY